MSQSWEEVRSRLLAWLTKELRDLRFRDLSWGPELDNGGKTCDLTVQITGGDLTFDTLLAFSRLLKTKLIDIGSGHESEGCPTCGYGCESWVELSIRRATLPIHIYTP